MTPAGLLRSAAASAGAGLENLFLSLMHTAGDVSDMLGAAQEAIAVVARRRPAR